MSRERNGQQRRAGVAFILAVLAAVAASAQGGPAAAATAAGSGQVAGSSLARRSTPQETLLGFLDAGREGDFAAAARSLDLSWLPPDRLAREGARLARRFFLILLHFGWVDPGTVSNEADGTAEPDLPDSQERLATLEVHRRTVDILLDRLTDARGRKEWLFSGRTVTQIDALYRAHGYGWIGDNLPSFFFSLSFLGLQLWQWSSLAFVLLLGYWIGRFVGHLLLRILAALARRTAAGWDDAVVAAVEGPVGVVLWCLAFALVAVWIGLPPETRKVVAVVWKLVTLVGFGWLLFRILDAAVEHMQRVAGEQNQVAQGYTGILTRTGKVVLGTLVFLGALDVVGVNVVALVTGLGIGGIAIAFAAQKTIENIFGGFSIAADRPFKVGDTVNVGTVTGTVEDVGLRSTSIRTLDRTVVSIPNGAMALDRIVNLSARDRFLYNPRLGLRYETSVDQLTWVIDEIRKLLLGHHRVLGDPQRVRFIGFGPSSLDVEVVAWLEAADFGEATALTEELSFAVMRIVERSGTSFAFPSQTLYLGRDGGIDTDRAAEVAREVAERRERGELAVPEPSPELRAALRPPTEPG